jgi:hypothetical protein
MLWRPKNLFLYDAPADNGVGGTSGGQPSGDPAKPNPAEIADFESWLKDQPENVRKAFESHTTGLRGALKTERETRQSLEKAAKDAEKAKQDADAETARKNGEWQKLAEQSDAKAKSLEAQLAELTPHKDRAERFGKALEAYLKTQREGLPAHILPLLDKLDPVEQLEYIAANAATLKKAPAGGPPATPPAADPSEANKANQDKNRSQFGRTVRGWF